MARKVYIMKTKFKKVGVAILISEKFKTMW